SRSFQFGNLTLNAKRPQASAAGACHSILIFPKSHISARVGKGQQCRGKAERTGQVGRSAANSSAAA
ncbi:MAG: hypothetical protein AB7F09_25620, partial [Parvibaculaceae bacterium]